MIRLGGAESAAYNDKTGLMIYCPLTSLVEHYPFGVLIAGSAPGAVLADQVKSLGWRSGQAARKRVAAPEELAEMRAKIRALVG